MIPADPRNQHGSMAVVTGIWFVVVLMLVNVIFTMQNAAELRKASTAKWEYRILSPSDQTLIPTLNEIGAEGWEVVEARRAMTDGTASYEIIMKRRVR